MLTAGHQSTSLALGGRAPSLIDPATDVAVWLVKPAGVVTSLGATTRITLAVATFLTGEAHAFSQRSHGQKQGLLAIHDWSRLTGYDPAARALLVDWCLAHRHELAFSGVVSPKVNALLDMAITVARTTLGIAHVPFDVSPSLLELCRARGISTV
jgi:hypothetical protein